MGESVRAGSQRRGLTRGRAAGFLLEVVRPPPNWAIRSPRTRISATAGAALAVCIYYAYSCTPAAKRINTMRDEYDFSNGKRGAVLPRSGKSRITIMIDDDVLEAFKSRATAEGYGYQTLINTTLRQTIDQPREKPLTVETLRKVLREELPRGTKSMSVKHR